MRIIWHPLASDGLVQIVQYCRDTFGYKTAVKVRQRYLKEIRLLSRNPNLGFVDSMLQSFGTLEYRSLVIENTKVIYTVLNEEIHIHLIWDCRRQPETIYRELDRK